jgi:diguanylate cyclase (GGDEF)-like protein
LSGFSGRAVAGHKSKVSHRVSRGDGAVVIGKRISHAISSLSIPHNANANRVVTISAGVAAIAGGDSTTEALVDNADHALYRAKDFGRNAVISATRGATNSAANPSVAA